jgi:hypothetical protein
MSAEIGPVRIRVYSSRKNVAAACAHLFASEGLIR